MKTLTLFIGIFMFVDLSAKVPMFEKKDLVKWMMQKNVAAVDVKKIDFRGGFKGGLHHHPCPVIGYIVKGTIEYQIEGEEVVILKQGDVFYEPANKTILRFDNSSLDEDATFVAFYLTEESDKNLIEMKAWKK